MGGTAFWQGIKFLAAHHTKYTKFSWYVPGELHGWTRSKDFMVPINSCGQGYIFTVVKHLGVSVCIPVKGKCFLVH